MTRVREIAAALASLRERVGPDEAGVLTLDAPARSVDAIFSLGLTGARQLWDEADGVAEAGVGEALRIEARGAARFDQLRARGASALVGLEEVRVGASHAPPPRLVGGFAFREAEAARARTMGTSLARWSAFGDASFVLARVTLGVAGASGYLRVVAPAGELADAGALATRIDTWLVALERAPGAPAGRGPLAGRALDDTSGEGFEALVADALSVIRAGALAKVVVARASRVLSAAPIDPVEVLARLVERKRRGVRFGFEREGAMFLGATPERLVTLEGRRVRTEALAGSLPRRADERPGEAESLARALLASDKDRREHAVVVDAITSALAPFVCAPQIAETPEVRTLRHVRHLATPIEAELARDAHVLELVARLHPTPAVGGVPRDAALAFIAAHEAAPRGWYAAPIGWFDARGQGSFAVALRSALVADREALVYAGAGIVEGSEPRLERLETRAKLGPALAALGVT